MVTINGVEAVEGEHARYQNMHIERMIEDLRNVDSPGPVGMTDRRVIAHFLTELMQRRNYQRAVDNIPYPFNL
jgi:hypothetical protein